ncbi:hypothetical protein BIV57_06615 [Mangrovactinospora gilvigrisea]|uniref:Peptidase S1 domain-containing protein n=1 Tax=Mangrovactinospora gilvigrisea TaxID=1428644 RepID=A0A1J7BI49_9ACTN|nr:hypothetical protein BIV57_06615 [Mangrovactinospora gilvigrisea]
MPAWAASGSAPAGAGASASPEPTDIHLVSRNGTTTVVAGHDGIKIAISGGAGQTQQDAKQLTAYWTPARMKAAMAGTGSAQSTAKGAGGMKKAAASPGDNLYDGAYPGEYVPPSPEFNGVPQAGTFFWTDSTGTGRTCSGSVLNSPRRNLVLSAGHCLRAYVGPNPARHLVFAPNYHDGLTPYGLFPIKVNGVYEPEQFLTLGQNAGAEYDFAIAQTLKNAGGQWLEQATGPGYRLHTDTGYIHYPATMIGYPGGASHTKPIECHSLTTHWVSTDPAAPGDFPRIPCQAFIGGTSGGPMIVHDGDSPSGWGVVGVVGGVHGGGNTESVSYSAYFGAATRALYNAAVAGAPPAQPPSPSATPSSSATPSPSPTPSSSASPTPSPSSSATSGSPTGPTPSPTG